MILKAPSRPASLVRRSRRPAWRISASWLVSAGIVLTFGTAISPFIIEGQKNALVIAAGLLSVPMLMFSRIPISRDAFWAGSVLLYLLAVEAMQDTFTIDEFISIGYTGVLAVAYVAFCGALAVGSVQAPRFRRLLRRLIYAYAATSILQLLTSFSGLPIPNLLLSKGLWSYNSLAVEPSHVGRILAFTMLVYLLLGREGRSSLSLKELWRGEKWVLLAVSTSCILSGSAIALGGLALTILLALRTHFVIIIVVVLAIFWPVLLSFEFEVLARLTTFLDASTQMDLDLMMEADHSGAVRIAPIMLFIEQMDVSRLSIWFGGGVGEIATYVQGKIAGVDADTVMAGFFPGFVIAFGFFGTALFLYAFLFRFFNKSMIPLFILSATLLFTSAWNSQVFWFGLLMLRALYHFQNVQPR